MTRTTNSPPGSPRRRPWRRWLVWWFCRLLVVVGVCAATGLLPNAFDWYGPISAHPWYLSAVHLDRGVTGTGAGVTVAVIDTGVDTGHSGLHGHVLPVACVDSGCSLQRHGDPEGHGTMVASVIVGQGGANQVPGVAPGATVLPVKIGSSSQQELAHAISYAATRASIISLSVGPPQAPQPVLVDAVRYAQHHDAVMVAATGNLSGAGQVVTPANIPGVIAVSGTSPGGRAYDGAVTGPQVALAAPADFVAGANSLTGQERAERWPVPAAKHLVGSGTSYSAPIVAGVAALVRSRYPRLDAGNVIQRLIATANNPTSVRTTTFGYGIVDADRAVTADVPTVASNPPLAAPPALYAAPPVRSSDDRLTKLYLAIWLTEGVMSLVPPNPLIWLAVRGIPTLITAAAVVFIPLFWRRLRRRRTRSTGSPPPRPRRGTPSAAPPPASPDRQRDKDTLTEPAPPAEAPALPANRTHEQPSHGQQDQ